MRIYGDLFRWRWFHVEVLRVSFFFSILQFLAFGDFVHWLGLLKCSKVFQNFCNLEIMFIVSKLEPDWFKWRHVKGDLHAYLLCFYYQEYQLLNLLDG